MAATLRLTADNQTGAAFRQVRADAAATGDAVGDMASTMRSASNDLERLADDNEDLRSELQNLQAEIEDLQGELGQLANKYDEASNSAKNLGQDGGKSAKGIGLQFTELNSVLELGKKALEGAKYAVEQLASSGTPAALRLTSEFGELQETLIGIADDPRISAMFDGLAEAIDQHVNPAIESIPGGLTSVQNTLAGLITQAGEFTGFFPEGTTEELASVQEGLAEVAEEQRRLNEEARENAKIFGVIEQTEQRIAAEAELRNIAAIENAAQLNALLEDEIDLRKELSEAGELAGDQLAASDARIEAIMRRRAELPGIIADRERTAAMERIEAEANAQKEIQEAIAKTAKEAAAARKSLDDQKTAAADKMMGDLRAAIKQAENVRGSLLKDLRAQFGQREVGKAIVDASREQARDRVIEEARGRGEVDQNGRAVGRTREEQQRNQVMLNRRLRSAQDQAERDARRAMARGEISEQQIIDVQNNLVLGQAEKKSGPLGKKGAAYQALQAEMQAERDAATGSAAQATSGLSQATGNLIDNTVSALDQTARLATEATQRATTAQEQVAEIVRMVQGTAANARAQRGRQRA